VLDLDLDVADGEFVVLVGPSGCGKSTSLRMLAGLEPVDEGAVYIDDKDVTATAPKDRDIAMVFQDYALYPHMTVGENMGFALRMAKRPKSEIRARVAEAARILDLEALLDRRPGALSGGQRQRVAMGRAIVRNPRVFLMDEPLSNLDAKLRAQTRTEIAALQQRLATTTIYVTHDQVEAMTMGDRIAVMNEGQLQQIDDPRKVYARPSNVFVARFIGSPAMNVCMGTLTDSGVALNEYEIPLSRETRAAAGSAETVMVGFRPESVDVAGVGEDGIDAMVNLVEELGADAFLFAELPHRDDVVHGADLVARVDTRHIPERGQRVRLRVRPDEVHVFSAETGERLS
jgi:multiple sugar transport system ATP-binding protein